MRLRTETHLYMVFSLDQTTRIHGASIREDTGSPRIETWHEIARPQIHGYDLISAVFIGPLRFVSIADEKVARVFDAPKGFVQTLTGMKTIQLDADLVSAILLQSRYH